MLLCKCDEFTKKQMTSTQKISYWKMRVDHDISQSVALGVRAVVLKCCHS